MAASIGKNAALIVGLLISASAGQAHCADSGVPYSRGQISSSVEMAQASQGSKVNSAIDNANTAEATERLKNFLDNICNAKLNEANRKKDKLGKILQYLKLEEVISIIESNMDYKMRIYSGEEAWGPIYDKAEEAGIDIPMRRGDKFIGAGIDCNQENGLRDIWQVGLLHRQGDGVIEFDVSAHVGDTKFEKRDYPLSPINFLSQRILAEYVRYIVAANNASWHDVRRFFERHDFNVSQWKDKNCRSTCYFIYAVRPLFWQKFIPAPGTSDRVSSWILVENGVLVSVDGMKVD